MIAHKYKTDNAGLPNGKNIGSSSPDAIMSFVKTHILNFTKEENYSDSSENKITRDLVVFLNQQANEEKSVFLFISQDLEGQSRASVDIGLYPSKTEGAFFNLSYYSSKKRFFCFEAKILGINGVLREKEYVVGHFENSKYVTCGGIERFKKCVHGKELEYACLLGYMKKYNFDYWEKSINCWIKGLISSSSLWNQNDLLTCKSRQNDILLELESTNSRIESDGIHYEPIKLYHIWIDIKTIAKE